jgi:hypothetical protein
MKVKILLLAVFLFSISMGAKDKSNDVSMRYDIECAGTGTEGTYLIKVWVYAKKNNVDENLLKKSAVHGVIFKGFAGAQGCTSQKPLASSPGIEQEKANFFNVFFANNGDYLKYASVVVGSTETIKVGKEFKIGVIVSISKDLLRKDLESAGVIRGLSSGF